MWCELGVLVQISVGLCCEWQPHLGSYIRFLLSRPDQCGPHPFDTEATSSCSNGANPRLLRFRVVQGVGPGRYTVEDVTGDEARSFVGLVLHTCDGILCASGLARLSLRRHRKSWQTREPKASDALLYLSAPLLVERSAYAGGLDRKGKGKFADAGKGRKGTSDDGFRDTHSRV